jgi:hypothetical protein
VLAFRLAERVGGARPSQQGAMQRIAHQPFGHALLLLTAIGLGGYALWRFTQAFAGHTPEYGEHSTMDRLGALRSGVAYAAFCVLGLSKKFLTYSKTGAMSHRVREAFTLIGVVGLVARAIAFALIGLFVLKAARDSTPKDAVGIDGALARLLQHSYGTAALAVVACGLIAFGAYSIADTRFRKI